jgi:uncharacterized protein (TIGR03067 family)
MNRTTLAIFLATAPLMGVPWPEVRPTPQKADGEGTQLVGAWFCVERVVDGVAIPVETFMNPLFLVIEDDRYIHIPLVWERPRVDVARIYDLAVDTRRTPKAFDITFRSIGGNSQERNDNSKREGIYRIDKDTLVTCVGRTRPADFAAPVGSGRTYSVYRMVKPRGPAVHPVPQAAVELDRLAGTWVPIEQTDNGYVLSREIFDRHRLRIAGNRAVHGYIDKAGRARFDAEGSELAVDPNQRPKAIDFVSRPGLISRWIDEGIYHLEGDTLSICIGSRDRPAEFAAPAGSGRSLEVYRREPMPRVDQRSQ